MDNEADPSESEGRRIALGLKDYLRGFAKRRNAQPWWRFAREDPQHWQLYVLELADDPGTTICFNRHGVNVWLGVARAVTPRQKPTDC